MGRRSRVQTPVPTASPAAVTYPPRPPLPEPSWKQDMDMWYNPQFQRVEWCVQTAMWALPPYQREVVWSGEQQAAFCRSVWNGSPTAPILAWRRWTPEGHVNVVLDGQQRLTALGVPIRRGDEVTCPCETAFWPMTGVFDANPHGVRLADNFWRWTAAKALAAMPYVEHLETMKQDNAAAQQEVDEEVRAMVWFTHLARERLANRCLVIYVLDTDTTADQAIAALRSFNRPGVVWSEEDIERRIAAVVDRG